jgi:hypothetical protein
MNYYGESKCVCITQARKLPCVNMAYYKDTEGKLVCGVHSKTKERIKLPVNPQKAINRQNEINRQTKMAKKAAKKNRKRGESGHIIVTKLRMMKLPEYVDGYITVFPNFKHQNRKDGHGCMKLSPKYLGPVVHNMSNLPISKNLENFHQFAKFWNFELDEDGHILPKFHKLRNEGYENSIPMRHKYQKNVLKKLNNGNLRPEFTMFFDQDGNEKRYSYLECRYFYCYFYEKLVKQEKQFIELQKAKQNGFNLNLSGYDGYQVDKSLWEHYNDITRPFGHELVLYTLLSIEDEHEYPWNRYYKENKKIYENMIM